MQKKKACTIHLLKLHFRQSDFDLFDGVKLNKVDLHTLQTNKFVKTTLNFLFGLGQPQNAYFRRK